MKNFDAFGQVTQTVYDASSAKSQKGEKTQGKYLVFTVYLKCQIN